MRLDNLVYNRIGNSFSALFSSPSFQIMEKVNAYIEVENQVYNYKIAGVSCIEEQDNIFKIHIDLNQKDIFLNFKYNGKIFLNVGKHLYEIVYKDDYFELPIEDFNLIMIFSQKMGKHISFEKQKTFFIKLPTEELFIKGVMEFLILGQIIS